MSFSRPIQWYHSYADPIWPDSTGTFNTLGPRLYYPKWKGRGCVNELYSTFPQTASCKGIGWLLYFVLQAIGSIEIWC